MRVFVTGATGFIGTAVIEELLGAGHSVIGLLRNDAGAQKLKARGVEVLRGDLEDLDSLRAGAKKADGVIHLAFVHDFSRFQQVCEIDRKAIEAMGEAMAGTSKVLIVTSGAALAGSGRHDLILEDTPRPSSKEFPRMASEEAAAAAGVRGVRAIVVRLPQVHDPRKQGLVTYWIAAARAKGIAAYVGDGQNRWPAAHLSDTARLYRLALEKGEGGAKYHAVAEEGVKAKDIAEAIGQGLGVPVVSVTQEEAGAHFGPLALFAGWDMPASSAKTRAELNWDPKGPTMLEDLKAMNYAEATEAA